MYLLHRQDLKNLVRKKNQRKINHTFSFSHDDQNLVDTGQNLVNWHDQSISMVTAYWSSAKLIIIPVFLSQPHSLSTDCQWQSDNENISYTVYYPLITDKQNLTLSARGTFSHFFSIKCHILKPKLWAQFELYSSLFYLNELLLSCSICKQLTDGTFLQSNTGNMQWGSRLSEICFLLHNRLQTLMGADDLSHQNICY